MNRSIFMSALLGAIFLQGCSVKKSESSSSNFQKSRLIVNGKVVEDTEFSDNFYQRKTSVNGVTSSELNEGGTISIGVRLQDSRGKSYDTYLNRRYPLGEDYAELFREEMGKLKNDSSSDDVLTSLENLTATKLLSNFYYGVREALFSAKEPKNVLKPFDFLKLDKTKYKSEIETKKRLSWVDFIESTSFVDEQKVAAGSSLGTVKNEVSSDMGLFMLPEVEVVPVDLQMAQEMREKLLDALKSKLKKVPNYDLASLSFITVEKPTELTDTVSTAQDRAPNANPRVEEIDFRFNLKGDIEDMARTHGWTGSGMLYLNNYHLGVAHSYANQGVGFKNGLQTETSAVALAVFWKAFIELQSGVVFAENVHKANWNGTRHLVTVGYDFANSITPFVQLSAYRVKSDREDQVTNPNGNKLYVGITVDAKSKEYALNKWSTLFTTKAGIQHQTAIYSMDLKQKFISQDGVSLSGALKLTNHKNSVVKLSVGWSN